MRNYYAILGLARTANEQEIRGAYHFFVKAFHPDKFVTSSDTEKTQAEERTKVTGCGESGEVQARNRGLEGSVERGKAIDHGNAWFLLSADGKTPYYPTSPASIGSPLQQNCAIPLGAPVDSVPPARDFIDELIFSNLKRIGVPPSRPMYAIDR